MDPELKHRLDEIHALARDNHHLLRAVRRHQLIATFGPLVVWLVVFLSGFYFYTAYLEPIAEKFASPGAPKNFLGLPTSAEFQKLLNSYKAGQ